MGVVYAARDERLERSLAIKIIASRAVDDHSRKRFYREARAAASVNHPNVCQLYDIDEEGSLLFIAMELLEGESLAERLKRGPYLVDDAGRLGLGILSALSALHERGIVHRDLKPSNVFLTPHGVKLLDFGLARTVEAAKGAPPLDTLTGSGALMGTPRYMAPEQVQGVEVDHRADLFATGAVLFEMLAGRPAFPGSNLVEVLYATLNEQPPALAGSPAVVAVDRVIRRAVVKVPGDRYPSAAAMADDLESALGKAGGGTAATPARALTRLVVLPFRVLRPDGDTDFLAYSLPDAITTSLHALESLIVRSSAAAARFAGETIDLARIAAEADVDLVLTGTLLRGGDDLRVSTQLVEAPGGAVVWSHAAQAPLGDMFRLQDDLARRIVESLSLPLAGREAGRMQRDVPRSARAYEFYLRANEVGRDYLQLKVARDLYLKSVEDDPSYAPAWARLGRCHRVIGKYFEEPVANRARAEDAFRRALELNPDLSLAHKLYAHLEAEQGQALEAMLRLLSRVQSTPNDPELFAGLVLACRYCGLLDASLAADEEARRLDPHVSTSVAFTLWLRRDYERLVRLQEGVIDTEPLVLALFRLGRKDEALAAIRAAEREQAPAIFHRVLGGLRALLEDRREEALAEVERCLPLHTDPEALFLFALQLAYLGEHARAIAELERSLRGGFLAVEAMEEEPWLAPLRAETAFEDLLDWARARREAALAAFQKAGGSRSLGLSGEGSASGGG